MAGVDQRSDRAPGKSVDDLALIFYAQGLQHLEFDDVGESVQLWPMARFESRPFHAARQGMRFIKGNMNIRAFRVGPGKKVSSPGLGISGGNKQYPARLEQFPDL